jgi:hypothetical protein
MFRKKRKLEFYDYHAASVIDCIGGVIVTMLASGGVIVTMLASDGVD